MYHYPKHVGDWMRDTAHLSDVEECIYSRLTDQYYAREKPLPADVEQCCRLARASSPAARKAVPFILGEFYQLQDDGWHQKRCDEEIAAFHAKALTASNSAKTRWNKKRAADYANAMRTHSEPSAEAMLTGNQNHNQEDQKQRPDASPKKRATPAGSRLSGDWKLPDEWRTYALTERTDWNVIHVERVALEFRDYWHSQAGPRARKADWYATWRVWVRRDRSTPGEAVNGNARKPAPDLWWSSETGVMAKAASVGLSARPGESLAELRGRINAKLDSHH